MKKLLLLIFLVSAKAQAPEEVILFNKWVDHVRGWQEFIMLASGCPVDAPSNNVPECDLGRRITDYKRFEKLRKQAKDIFDLREK